MKNIFFLLFLISTINWGQNNCDHDVSTNPLAPSNSALPVGSSANQYLNHFDWFPVRNDGIYDDYTCSNISFGGVQYSEMNNILLNSLPDYDYLTEGPLPLNINGWELLLVNLGRYPDDVTVNSAGNYLYAMPYIVLYNRYSSTVRVFVNFGLDHTVGNGADAIEIELYIPSSSSNLNGVLRINEGTDKTLDKVTTIRSVSSICKAPAFGQQWASTDFKISYDPCVCYFPSSLKLEIKQLSSSTIELAGRAVTLPNQPLVNNSTLQVNPTDFLSGFNSSTEANGEGIVIEKTMETMINNYLEKYEKYNEDLIAVGEHNAKVKKNLSILKMAKAAISLMTNPPVGLIVTTANMTQEEIKAQEINYANFLQEIAIAENSLLTTLQIISYYQGLETFEEYQEQVDWFKTVEKLVPGIIKIGQNGEKLFKNADLFKAVSQIFGEKGKAFISENFIERPMPSPPTMPTATFTELKYVGTLNDDLLVGGPKFYTPGTYGSEGTGFPNITNVYEYPIYNESLGTFALLESPKISLWSSGILNLISNSYNKIESNCTNCGYPYNVETYRYKSWKRNYEIKLKNDLRYVFNSALDIKSTDVKVAFDIVAKPLKIGSLPVRSKLSVFNNGAFKANTNSNSIDLSQNSAIYSYGQSYNGNNTNPDYIDEHFSTSIQISKKPLNDIVKIQTPYLPVDAFYPIIGRFGLMNEYESFGHQEISTNDVWNTDIFYGDQTPPYNLNWNSSVLINKALDYNVMNGYKYEFEIEMKLIVDIEFNSINQYGSNNKVTQIYTYKIDPANVSIESVPMSGNLSVLDLEQYPFDLFLNTTDFHGQNVEGCKLLGNNYTCQAQNNVEITGDLTTSNGYNVTIKGGNEISVVGESMISPEVVLEINPVLDYSHPMPNVSSSYLTGFCKGTNTNAPAYLANLPTKMLEVDQSSSNNFQLVTDREKVMDFLLFPNPSTSEVNLIFNQIIGQANVVITDLSGKQLFSQNFSEVDKIHLEMSEYSSGAYMIVVKSSQGNLTKQLIKH